MSSVSPPQRPLEPSCSGVDTLDLHHWPPPGPGTSQPDALSHILPSPYSSSSSPVNVRPSARSEPVVPSAKFYGLFTFRLAFSSRFAVTNRACVCAVREGYTPRFSISTIRSVSAGCHTTHNLTDATLIHLGHPSFYPTSPTYQVPYLASPSRPARSHFETHHTSPTNNLNRRQRQA